MQVTLTISDDFVAQVQSRTLSIEVYAQDLLDHAVQEQQRIRGEQHREAVDAMLRFASERGLTLGGEDLKSMVHEGHKC